MVIHLPPLLNLLLIAKMYSVWVFSFGFALVDFHLNWLSLFHFLIPMADPLVIRLHAFSVTISRCYEGVYVNKIFPYIARLLNCLPAKCFSLTYGLDGFKSAINRHFLSLGSLSLSLSLSLFYLWSFSFLFLVTPCLIVAVQSAYNEN